MYLPFNIVLPSIRGNSEKIFQQVDHLDNDRTVIVLDPPRKGCDPFFLQQLL